MTVQISESKTRQLQEWLTAKIEETEDDVKTLSRILAHQRSHPGHVTSFREEHPVQLDLQFAFACCCSMVSEQRKEAIIQNEEKQKRIKERLESLRLAQAFEFRDGIEELERVFGAPCQLDLEKRPYPYYGWLPNYELPPIIKWSPSLGITHEAFKLDFFLVLSKRVLIVRHNMPKKGGGFAFSEIQVPHLVSVTISKWPETILISFEHNGERSHLQFDRFGGLRAQDGCFLK